MKSDDSPPASKGFQERPNPDTASPAWLVRLAAVWCLALSACQSSTVFQANFTEDPIGSPPAVDQEVGRVVLAPGSGSIRVVPAPAAGLPPNKWAEIQTPDTRSAITEMTAHFTRFGPGRYSLLASLHIPPGSGTVTVAFEGATSRQPQGDFMHLDFLPNGTVRFNDDDSHLLGTFTHGRNFVLSVTFEIYPTTAVGELTLLGPGASGSQRVAVPPSLMVLARNFGLVNFLIGFPNRGGFFVDDILVTRENL